jgi:hypothetical protein
LSTEEEEMIVERLVLLGEWGFPMTTKDLCLLVKAYLDSLGKTTRFIDNLPGPDFIKGFMKRHPRLTVRTANMIKRSRAALSVDEVKAFFERYEKTAAGIPPENIWNYDETNLRDNPGAQKAIFKRGVKYAEQVRDHSKTAISVMFCASGTGVVMPPYVVYKAMNIYDSWCCNGVKGAVYNSSSSGWFDMHSFTDWFQKIFLPHVRRQPGRKLLIGDNLASHISVEVISQCRDNNIQFVCLPPNSTDKMQPLDVGFFGPMKQAWRKQLKAYSDRSPSAKLLQKTEFPRMLKEWSTVHVSVEL